MKRATTFISFLLVLIWYLAAVSNGATIPTSNIDDASLPLLKARQRTPTKLTTKIPLPNKTTLIVLPGDEDKAKIEEREFYHPAAVSKPRLIERYDKRALDGHYEYRYVLSNGDVRYERAYWLPVGGNSKVLARKGYYSYPLPNHRFHTVFYTADQNGFREDESSYTRTQPILPRSIEVANLNDDILMEKVDKMNKIQRKSNWMPTTKSILQKGRIVAIDVQETGTGMETTKTKTTATSTATRKISILETSATVPSATNRPQINKEEASSTAIAIATATTNAKSTPKAQPTKVKSSLDITNSQSIGKSETINPIKTQTIQTTVKMVEAEPEPEAIGKATATATSPSSSSAATAIETEAKQLETVDTTTTVLSVD